MRKMRLLFQSGYIGNLKAKNRIVMAPMGIRGLVELDGRFSQRAIEYYATRAAGGAGLIITGIAYVDVEVEQNLAGVFCPSAPRVDSPMFMSRVEELANAVHAYEAKIVVQLTAGRGRIASADDARAKRAVAPSPIPCFWEPNIKTRELTLGEIQKLIKAFGVAATLLREAGIDGVEIHGHEGYLIDEFMTSLWNMRTDKYGGTLDGRLQFPLEIIESIKSEAGADFPIIFKFGASHHIKGGRDIEESCEIGKRLEDAGVHALEVDAGCYETSYWAHPPIYMSPGALIGGAETIKKAIDIPIIAVGKLGYPELAEQILVEGKADFIGLGRPLLADPEWPLKVKEGRFDDIRVCIGCHDGCLARLLNNRYISCAINPATGIERELVLSPSRKKKKVLVVGGGPGGMEAARVAALRGHNVALWEKGHKLGGNLIPASIPDFKEDLRYFVDYLSNQLKKLSVNVNLTKEATPELVCDMDPDEVFIASGATPYIPNIPGFSKDNTVTAIDALLGRKNVGESVLVLGGGTVGSETAAWLAQLGKKVTIIEILPDILGNMFFTNRMMLMRMLIERGIRILTSTNVLEIAGDEVVFKRNGKTASIRTDTLVLAVGMKAQRELFDNLEDKVPSVHAIGDCVEPRNILNAIWEAYRIAQHI